MPQLFLARSAYEVTAIQDPPLALVFVLRCCVHRPRLHAVGRYEGRQLIIWAVRPVLAVRGIFRPRPSCLAIDSCPFAGCMGRRGKCARLVCAGRFRGLVLQT